jgi:uncharacterized membrane protein (UPF0127 family)
MDQNLSCVLSGCVTGLRKRKFSPALCFFLFFLLAVFSFGRVQKRFVQIFFPNGEVLTAELALTEEDRARGLMFRKDLNEDQGMLFVFEEEGRHAFWMKNMTFSIDILWLDRQKRIVHIEHRVPPCQNEPCPSYPPDYPALYVLELRAGAADALNLQLFDRIEFVLLSSCSFLF